MEGNGNENPKLPTRYVPLGGEFVRYGVRLVCIRRPYLPSVSGACKGCFFKRSRVGDVVVNCDDIQCSSWDRMDGLNVWFREKDGKAL